MIYSNTITYLSFIIFIFVICVVYVCDKESTSKIEVPIEVPIGTDFTYEHQPITYDEIMKSSLDKIDMIDMMEDDVIEPEPRKWKCVHYGGIAYAVDENGYYHDRQGRVWETIIVDTTAYTWTDDGYDPSIGAGDGKTATGKNAIKTYGIASGSPQVPRGSFVHVAGYGQFEVDDTGGRLKSDWKHKRITTLDLRIPQLRYDGVWRSIRSTRAIALKHGRQKNRIVLLLISN